MAINIVKEDVPTFIRRLGDMVFEGSNNTIIILGTDRAKNGPAGLKDGLGHPDAKDKGKDSATIHLISGRKDKDPDFDKDKSFIYITSKTDVDDNLNLKVEQVAKSAPAIILKSDHLRLVHRKDIKICLPDGKSFILVDKDKIIIKIGSSRIEASSSKIIINSDKIELTDGAASNIIKGPEFKKFFVGHKHPTPTGLSGEPVDVWSDSDLLSQKAFVGG